METIAMGNKSNEPLEEMMGKAVGAELEDAVLGQELSEDEMEAAAGAGGDYETCRVPQAQSCPNLQSFHQDDQKCVRRVSAQN